MKVVIQTPGTNTYTEEKVNTKRITIFIGAREYRLSESQEGDLVINKSYSGGDSRLSIQPSVSNEILIK